MVRSGSVRRSSSAAAAPAFTASPGDYRLLEEVGYGAHAVVYRAVFLPSSRIIAVKCLDLDRVNSNLDDIRKEAQTMSLIDHPNVIRAYCSFVVDHNLWVIMPFMAEGSCLHLMKVAYPDGFEEPVICSILKETLKALEYLHRQGHIHRDVKAGNILMDSPGIVKLGDFGVSACMFDRGDRQRSRNTFVGTPCWMAPEVLQPGAGYNFKADIWSFGITALELAHGHAPFSKYPPMKVLLMTLQNAPPGLDYDRDKKFSKSFKEMVAMCLVKDQTKRPTAEKLLKHSFFKSAKLPELSVKNILTDLPPLWDRVKALKLKDAAQLALKKMPSSEQEALSMSEYQRGVSAWNFDIEDLKAQASLILDDDPPEIKEDVDSDRVNEVVKEPSSGNHFGQPTILNGNFSEQTCVTAVSLVGNTHEADRGLVSEPGNADSEKKVDGYKKQGSENESLPSTSKHDSEGQNISSGEDQQKQRTYSGPISCSGIHNRSATESSRISDREAAALLISDKKKSGTKRTTNLSGPLALPTRASANSLSAPIRSSGGYVGSLGDKPKRSVVEIKGRFSVTSENVDLAKVQEVPTSGISRKLQEGSALRKSASVGHWPVDAKPTSNSLHRKELCNGSVSASILIPHLRNLVQQTTFQQDLITNLLSSLQQNEKTDATQYRLGTVGSDTGVKTSISEGERSLLVKIFELQSRMISLTDELITTKLKHVQVGQRQADQIVLRNQRWIYKLSTMTWRPVNWARRPKGKKKNLR
ncbi:serine/threonine-protein kinase OSR1-like isoform X2 [Oryza brachyantha]|uniref:serine/threonine-protein kinase OSR1-like isoform X2 n=1 Tax=Oryza brachyantha TaxID=4533 RepID=UPI001ADC8709|nr:serine/threonine-protein kinase OSR1-like isoform X2 [Oryza brachyantha]